MSVNDLKFAAMSLATGESGSVNDVESRYWQGVLDGTVGPVTPAFELADLKDVAIAADGWMYNLKNVGTPMLPLVGDWRYDNSGGMDISQRYDGEGIGWVEKAFDGDSSHADAFVLTDTAGVVMFQDGDCGCSHHSLIKVSVDGLGAVVGSGLGRVVLHTGYETTPWHAYLTSPTTTLINDGGPLIPNTEMVMSITFEEVIETTELLVATGVPVLEGNVPFRVVYKKRGTNQVILVTDDAYNFKKGLSAKTVPYNTEGYSMVQTEVEWPASQGLLVDKTYEFLSPVTVLGTGTHGVDWKPGWQAEIYHAKFDNIPSFSRWYDGQYYEEGEWLYENKKIYQCLVSGTQTGTLEDNLSTWAALSPIANTLVKDAVLGGIPTDTSITVASVPVRVPYVANRRNLHGAWSDVTKTYTVPQDGMYFIMGRIALNYGPSGGPNLAVRVNGVSTRFINPASGGDDTGESIDTVELLSEGDIVDFAVSGWIDTDTILGGQYSFFSIVQLS